MFIQMLCLHNGTRASKCISMVIINYNCAHFGWTPLVIKICQMPHWWPSVIDNILSSTMWKHVLQMLLHMHEIYICGRKTATITMKIFSALAQLTMKHTLCSEVGEEGGFEHKI